MSRIFLIVCSIFFLPVSTITAAPGDTLIITGDIVNLREGPSTSYPVLLKLRKNQRITETLRMDEWVRIKTGRPDVSTGWVYAGLIKIETDFKNNQEPDNGVAADSLFGLFKLAFAEFDEKLFKQTGKSYFTGVEAPGNRIVRLTVSEAWYETNRPERNAILDEVFLIWGTAVGDGIPVTVEIVDPEGNKLMSKFR